MRQISLVMSALIALAVTVGAAEPVPIYVGAMERDGFVDVDKGVIESIKDLQGELRKNKALRVVSDAASAKLRLYVSGRTKTRTGDTTSTTIGSGTAQPGHAQGAATTVTSESELHRLAAMLRVGDYERAFVGESEPHVMPSTWKRCAQRLANDVDEWVEANRERLTSAPKPAQSGR